MALNGRLKRVQEIVKNSGLDMTVVTDGSSISYLIGIEPSHMMERLMALAIPAVGDECRLFINELYPTEEGEGYKVVYHTDSDVATKDLAKYIPAGKVGLDKFMLAKFVLELMEQRKDVEFVLGSFTVDRARMIKDEKEKEAMRYASKVNDAVFAVAPSLVREGMTEIELCNLLCEEYIKLGDPDNAPEPLICFGVGAAEPHHTNSNKKLEPGDVVLIDSGQRTFGYFSDTTRTFFYKSITEEQKKVYEIVCEANARARAAIKPGARFCDIDAAARDYITEQGYGKYFTHRTGHCIGRDCHEEPSVSSANTAVIEPGTCFSIEPGIYLPGKFGVRIEDLVMVTEDGYELLVHAPKDIVVIE